MAAILVCTPALSGDLNFQFVLSLIRFDRACRDAGIVVDYQFVAHESLIPRARNYLCDVFLHQSTHTHLLFLDADIEFDPADILKMLQCDVDLIGGVYPKKKIHWERARIDAVRDGDVSHMLDYVVTPLPEAPVVPCVAVVDPVPVKYIGTGMMLIQRHVLETIASRDPSRVYSANGRTYYLYFDCIIHEGEYLSEDYYFCEMWRRAGGIVHAAYWTRATHWGLMGYPGAPLS